jgi:fumarate hydratase class II
MGGRKRGLTRRERDTLGAVTVPADALFGAQTARAVANFTVSGWTMPAAFLAALARIKAALARAHGETGRLAADIAGAIAAAADEVAAGRRREQFPVDVFQTGSGTSTNMNMNEVLAHLANLRLGGDPTCNVPVHPNDHVNLGQSSNDVIPTALRIAAALAWRDEIAPALEMVVAEFRRLARTHARTVTLGRTHLVDAVPTTYGRVFDAWAVRLAGAVEMAQAAAHRLRLVPLGGTAVGTGISADGSAVVRALARLRRDTGLALAPMPNPAAGIAAQDDAIAYADVLAGIARVLLAIVNDIRLRASGPAGGLGELELPAVQPGSSLMPGKLNPVIPEAVAQAALEAEGLAAACRASAHLHQLDLSHANPLLAWNLDAMARLLAGSCRMLATRCLAGLRVNAARARALAERSPALATALAARIGYERAAEVAGAAIAGEETVMQAARRLQVLPEGELAELLDLARLAGVEGVPTTQRRHAPAAKRKKTK